MLHLRLATPFSYLWVCPECSTTWCVADSLFHGKPHLFIHALCQPCGGGELTADYWIDQDSLLDTTLDHLLTHLPYDQLIREATLYLEELFNGNTSEQLSERPEQNTTIYSPGYQHSIVDLWNKRAADILNAGFLDSEGSESPP